MNDKSKVAAVCGNEARIYGPMQPNNRRPLMTVMQFPHYGAARDFAVEFDAAQKQAAQRNERG